MEPPAFHNLFDRRPITKSKAPATKWFKEWVPQDVVATGGKCFLLKWVNEATLKALKEKPQEPEVPEPEPKPATDVLFLCSYEGCGKTFIDAGALRKHSHIHGERQYICHYENCGKKFLDSSKLKRHFLIHTGERNYMCPHEGCGKRETRQRMHKHIDMIHTSCYWKADVSATPLPDLLCYGFNPVLYLFLSSQAFSLDFNLKSHMKTHSQENYHVCPYPECGKRYAHEYKLKNHVASAHQKTTMPDATKYNQPVEKPNKTAKSSGAVHASASSNRPYICPYEGCDKAYIHEYKLNLHLRKEHPRHFPDESAKNAQPAATENEMDEDVAQDTYPVKRKNTKTQKQTRPKPNLKPPPAKARRQNAIDSPANLSAVNKPWPVKEDEDSEETEEEKFNVGDQWRYRENEDDEDEDTELEN